MTVKTSSGASISIGPQAGSSVDSLSEFEALSYTPIGEVESIGEFGDESAFSNFTALSDGRVRKLKAAFDAGTIALVVGHDPLDAGQQEIDAALPEKFDYAFKVTLPDQPTAGSEPSNIYFRGQVGAARFNVGDQANVTRRPYTIAVNSAIVFDRATPT